MMTKSTLLAFAVTALIWSTSGAHAARPYYVNPALNGTYSVYDPQDHTTVYVRDAEAYVHRKYGLQSVDGFGVPINEATFEKGSNPVADTAATVVTATETATQKVTSKLPAWTKYVHPLRVLFGSTSGSAGN